MDQYSVVPMPVNANGDGPEMDSSKVAKTIYEIWDVYFVTVSSHETEAEARKEAARLNSKTGTDQE